MDSYNDFSLELINYNKPGTKIYKVIWYYIQLDLLKYDLFNRKVFFSKNASLPDSGLSVKKDALTSLEKTELFRSVLDLELLLLKVGQSPAKQVQEALLPSMKALIADDLLGNSDTDIKVAVATCLNEIMRVSAPVAPYDDHKMKEIFELIVSSFDKLSSLYGLCYSKAVSILENVARLRSCVMMLDLDCDPLTVKMFELLLKNIRSDHPHSVFLAMETIMSVMIKESDAVSTELLKVLLESIRKGNKNASPASCKLGAKVFIECADKLNPYIMTTMKSLGCFLEDYAPILSSICKKEPDTVKNLVDDAAKHGENNEPSAEKSPDVEHVQSLKAIEHCSQDAVKTNVKALADLGTESGSAASKRAKKSNSLNPDGHDNLSGKGKVSIGNRQGRLKKRSLASKSEEKAVPALENVASTPLGDSSKKKGRLPNKDVSGEPGKKSTTGSSRNRKDKSQLSDASKSQKKRASLDDDVIETPHGRKNYKEDLVGCRIKVWWPLDQSYYEGTICSFSSSTKKHKVDYDDGDAEILNLRKERWEFIGDETLADVDLLDVKQTPQPPLDGPQPEGSTECDKYGSQNHTGEKGVVVPDSGAESGEGSQQVTQAVDKSKMAEVVSETKRPRLSDG